MTMVSIIIPVYNAEKYIEECLDSLLAQTYPDFEIICVDDGSEDRSLEILRRYENQDGRITVLTQKNQYAGVARNTGMERATGKYLLFLDADDFFCEDMLEQALHEAENKQTEILVFDAYIYDEVRKEVKTGSWTALLADLFGDGVKTAADVADVLYQFTTPSPWNKLFLREHVEKNKLHSFRKLSVLTTCFSPMQRYRVQIELGYLERSCCITESEMRKAFREAWKIRRLCLRWQYMPCRIF